MKRKEFIRQLVKEGYILLRHGARHDLFESCQWQETACSQVLRD
jgi:hypothetical protein